MLVGGGIKSASSSANGTPTKRVSFSSEMRSSTTTMTSKVVTSSTSASIANAKRELLGAEFPQPQMQQSVVEEVTQQQTSSSEVKQNGYAARESRESVTMMGKQDPNVSKQINKP